MKVKLVVAVVVMLAIVGLFVYSNDDSDEADYSPAPPSGVIASCRLSVEKDCSDSRDAICPGGKEVSREVGPHPSDPKDQRLTVVYECPRS
jgi:hypothetical protein